ncbi:MAG: hypothetical protein RO257_16385 [Candidatus Kapabacteria bacterium]|nr:hypothetical protein [Candidatus Kapabacteria bacterium]
MAFLIDNNSFTTDSNGVRVTRLQFLSASIDTYAVELGITGDLLTWAQNAYSVFEDLRSTQTIELGEKDEAFQTSQESDATLSERYQILKDILISRYNNDNDILKIYGFIGQTPDTHDSIISAANDLIKCHNEHKAAGDTLVLPDAMISNFQTLTTNAINAYYTAYNERMESNAATRNLRALYDVDSKRLRALYSWTIATWSKFDPRLIVLGFTQATERVGGRVSATPTNLAYDEVSHVFSWDAVPDSTSYQLAYCPDGQPVQDWMSDYSGTENHTVFEPGDGDWLVKIRARNVNGYSDWSLTQNVHYESGLPAPDYITVSLTQPSMSIIALTWGEVTGATVYRLFQSAVALEAPVGPYVLLGEYTETSYQGTATAPYRHYFQVVAANDTQTSPPSDSVYIDIQLVE